MKITLITACFNSARTLRTALDSVRAQRGVDLEYIVIDGASTDGTVDIIKDFAASLDSPTPDTRHSSIATAAPRAACHSSLVFKWVSEPDRGMYDAINKGIALATGEIIGILNSDDLLETPDTLSHIERAFTGDTEVVYADIRFVRDDLETTIRRYRACHWRRWMHNWGYMPPHPSVYIRREAFARLGGYKLGYAISADFELMVRYLCRNRLASAYLPESVVKMRMGGLSTKNWRSIIVLNRENVRANRENGYFSCLAMMLPKYAFKVWGFILPRLP